MIAGAAIGHSTATAQAPPDPSAPLGRPATEGDVPSRRIRLETWDLTVAPIVDSVSRRMVALEVILPAGPPRRVSVDLVDCDPGSLEIEVRNGEALVMMNGWRRLPEEEEVRCLWRIDIRTWEISELPELRPVHPHIGR